MGLALSIAGLIGAAAALSGGVLPEGSAISFEQLMESLQQNLDQFGGLDDEPAVTGERRRLEVPDHYYDKCVFWVNAMRAREGLPALQRWRDFEDCSDRGAKYDARKGEYHASISRGMFCDWRNYLPVAQNTCPNWFHDGDSLESCNTAMWRERDLLMLRDDKDHTRRRLGAAELVCENGKPAEECAGHYLNLRGGKDGYNAFDRVACGFFVTGSNRIWINQNFGSGQKTVPDALAAPEQFQPYGFACGGDKNTRPVSLLSDDCGLLLDTYQYDDCEAEYRQDYRWHGCLAHTCDAAYDGPCDDFTVSKHGHVLLDGSGEDICSGQVLEAPCTDPWAINFPKGSRVWHNTRSVCRKSCGTCKCTVKPFDVGFRSVVETNDDSENFVTATPEVSIVVTEIPVDTTQIPASSVPVDTTLPPATTELPVDTTELPVTSLPIDTTLPPASSLPVDTTLPPATEEHVEPTTASTPPPAADCGPLATRNACVKVAGCQWDRSRTCVSFDGDCSALSRGRCAKSGGCAWNNDARPRRCEQSEM